MPASSTIDPTSRLGTIRFWGEVSGAELLAVIGVFAAREEWTDGYRVLWDASGVTSLDLEPEDAMRLADVLAALRLRLGSGRSAIVAEPGDTLSSGLLLKALSARAARRADPPPREIELFTDLEAALGWLGVPDPPAPASPDCRQPPASREG